MPTTRRRPGEVTTLHSGLGCKQDDLDAARRVLSDGSGVEGPGCMGAEADRGDLAMLEPAGGLDRVLLDEVVADGVGLLLGEDLGEILVAVVVGKRGDHDFRPGPAGLLAPSGDLVEPGTTERGQDRASGLEEIVGSEGPAVPRGPWLEQHPLAVEVGAAIEIPRQRPGLLEGVEVLLQGREGALAPP